MKPVTPLLKGSLNTIILNLLAKQDKMYGYEITKRVKDLSEGNFVFTEGALYPALHKLEADGLVDVSIEQIENRQRKYYSLTKKGKLESKEKIKELGAFFAQMEQVLNIKLSM